MREWAEECWPFHAEMIDRLDVRVVLCMGAAPANFVRSKVGSHTEVAAFVEANNRRMKSRLYVGGSVAVLQAAHPSRSYWYTEPCDLTPLESEPSRTDRLRLGPRRPNGLTEGIVAPFQPGQVIPTQRPWGVVWQWGSVAM